jgi:hypothetical protein
MVVSAVGEKSPEAMSGDFGGWEITDKIFW